MKTGSWDWMTCTRTITSSSVLMTSTTSFSKVCSTAYGKRSFPRSTCSVVSISRGTVNCVRQINRGEEARRNKLSGNKWLRIKSIICYHLLRMCLAEPEQTPRPLPRNQTNYVISNNTNNTNKNMTISRGMWQLRWKEKCLCSCLLMLASD